MKPVRKRTIIVLGVLAGIILSVPLSLAIIRWKSENRGVVLNHWRVSMRTGNFGSNYLLRAAVAVHSLGNPIPEEAMFFHGFFDNEGKKLNGRHRYRIRFKAGGLPPVDAFWSLTVYDRDGWLVPNQLDRYSLSDRSRGWFSITTDPLISSSSTRRRRASFPTGCRRQKGSSRSACERTCRKRNCWSLNGRYRQ